jgi:hypothetical protein
MLLKIWFWVSKGNVKQNIRFIQMFHAIAKRFLLQIIMLSPLRQVFFFATKAQSL